MTFAPTSRCRGGSLSIDQAGTACPVDQLLDRGGLHFEPGRGIVNPRKCVVSGARWTCAPFTRSSPCSDDGAAAMSLSPLRDRRTPRAGYVLWPDPAPVQSRLFALRCRCERPWQGPNLDQSGSHWYGRWHTAQNRPGSR